MRKRNETALYAPVKLFLEAQGYEVRGEVKSCDLVAVRGDELVVVELKPAVNLTLVLQGIERLTLTDAVYLAVEAPKSAARRHWYKVQGLCRRLGLGLIAVHFAAQSSRVEIVCDPGPYAPRPAPKKRRFLLGEFHQRTGDYNVGGGNRRPVVTVYREEALRVANALLARGTAKVKDLRQATGSQKTGAILQDNHYGWFERVERGVYKLTERGEQAIATYADVIGGFDLKGCHRTP
ncbi:MAG: DUF2161 domain-containing phosphodiesterase [Bacteroidota bacterium]